MEDPNTHIENVIQSFLGDNIFVDKNVPASAQFALPPTEDPNKPVQQTNVYRDKYKDICTKGLPHTSTPKSVVIVGAGIAGLAAAYLLKQAKFTVTILEASDRVGGRLKTFQFVDGVHEEAGAMRLPGAYDKQDPWDINTPGHYLTDYFGSLFKIKRVPFHNKDPNSLVDLHGTVYKANEISPEVLDKVYPRWREPKKDVKSPDELFGASTGPVEDEIKNALSGVTDPVKQSIIWNAWLNKYSVLSTRDYLTGKIPKDSGITNPYIWNIDSLLAYEKTTYFPLLEHSLCEILLDDLGLWWKDPMHKYEDGMEALPKAFVYKGGLAHDIVYGASVHHINTSSLDKIHVHANTPGGIRTWDADYVIVTAPLNIISNITFTPSLPKNKQDALTKVTYVPSTKVVLQFRKKFWLKDHNLRGGFTKSTTFVGQFHYSDSDPTDNDSDKRGALVCYTWNQEALVWQSMPPEQSISLVAHQIARIHATKVNTDVVDVNKKDEILGLLEGGKVQAWYAEPTAQGAFVLYNAFSADYLRQLATPFANFRVYFAGEGISFTHGWIQGALESAFMAASVLAAVNQLK